MTFRNVTFAIVGTFVAVLVLTQCIERANSHSWYDQQCCRENDCYQVALGEVEFTEHGWLIVATRELIPFDDPKVKHSPDGLVHRCGIWDPDLPQIEWPTRCLYVSTGG